MLHGVGGGGGGVGSRVGVEGGGGDGVGWVGGWMDFSLGNGTPTDRLDLSNSIFLIPLSYTQIKSALRGVLQSMSPK